MKLYTYQQDSLNNQVTRSEGNQDTVRLNISDSSKLEVAKPLELKTTVKKIRSLSNVDSLFLALEKKETEVKRIKKEEALQKARVEIKTIDTLPAQLAAYQNTHILQPLNNNLADGNFRAQKKIFATEKNLKTGTQLSVKELTGSAYPTDFVMGILLVVMTAIILLKLMFSKYFTNYFQTAFNYQLTGKLLRDKNAFLSRFNLILNFIYVITLAIFVYQSIYFFDINSNPSKSLFVYIVIVILGIVIARYLALMIIGEIFNVRKEFSEYLFNQLLFNKLLGLLLIPLVFIIQYVNDNVRLIFLTIGALLISGSFLFKLVRGYTIIVKKDILIYYVLLYLCTLEILPVLVGFFYLKRLI